MLIFFIHISKITPFFPNKCDRHDITEILLKVVLNTITSPFSQQPVKLLLTVTLISIHLL